MQNETIVLNKFKAGVVEPITLFKNEIAGFYKFINSTRINAIINGVAFDFLVKDEFDDVKEFMQGHEFRKVKIGEL